MPSGNLRASPGVRVRLARPGTLWWKDFEKACTGCDKVPAKEALWTFVTWQDAPGFQQPPCRAPSIRLPALTRNWRNGSGGPSRNSDTTRTGRRVRWSLEGAVFLD